MALCLLSFNAIAQNQEARLSVGIPLFRYGKFNHNFANANKTNFPAFLIQADKKWKTDMYIGAYVGYCGQKYEYNYGNSESTYHHYRLGGVFTYELNDWLLDMEMLPTNELEFYASAKLGISLENRRNEFLSSSSDSNSNPVFFKKTSNKLLLDCGGVLGARYCFSQFALFGEIGWGNAGFLTIGATFVL